ncbi:hypothetical protein CDEST_06159 [Colletotrichum destructivum]|uniref:Uncharacterized protein n=1 Tax=Colletotrichum destructivum TaxID=34406 RepID=A0AAX4ICM9_9PEZI|nr:hypothetical protein CDEST_06159 [Colletotrichum destructivum]
MIHLSSTRLLDKEYSACSVGAGLYFLLRLLARFPATESKRNESPHRFPISAEDRIIPSALPRMTGLLGLRGAVEIMTELDPGESGGASGLAGSVPVTALGRHPLTERRNDLRQLGLAWLDWWHWTGGSSHPRRGAPAGDLWFRGPGFLRTTNSGHFTTCSHEMAGSDAAGKKDKRRPTPMPRSPVPATFRETPGSPERKRVLCPAPAYSDFS